MVFPLRAAEQLLCLHLSHLYASQDKYKKIEIGLKIGVSASRLLPFCFGRDGVPRDRCLDIIAKEGATWLALDARLSRR